MPPTTPPQAFDQQNLPTGDGHSLYVAQYGKPDGAPAVVLHGGPGSGTRPSVLDWFDLSTQRVVLFDQRGAGRSLPHGSLINNDSQRLVADIELIRETLGIGRWMVVGGSWGATLALMYAEQHAARMSALVLRGSFLASERELQWFFQSLRAMVPGGWAQMTAGWDEAAKSRVLDTLAAALLRGHKDGDRSTAQAAPVSDAQHAAAMDAALRWGGYESSVMQAMTGKLASAATGTDGKPGTNSANATNGAGSGDEDAAGRQRMLNLYRLQAHYLTRGCFTSEQRLLAAAAQLTDIPVVIVHGTHDLVCPPENALRLQQAMPHARLHWVEKGGHTPADPAVAAALTEAIAALAGR
jgi:proline iminopeptidase